MKNMGAWEEEKEKKKHLRKLILEVGRRTRVGV